MSLGVHFWVRKNQLGHQLRNGAGGLSQMSYEEDVSGCLDADPSSLWVLSSALQPFWVVQDMVNYV